MSKKDISYYINKDHRIITCKKRAKELLIIAKLKYTENNTIKKVGLNECQNEASREIGFKDWFDLYHHVKRENTSSEEQIEQDLTDKFNHLLSCAFNDQASDIHFECRNNATMIRMRKHGELYIYKQFQFKENHIFLDYIFKHLLNMSNVNYSDCQSGRTHYCFNNHNMVISCQSIPSYPSGTDLILKILYLDKELNIQNLVNLGYTQQQYDEILKMISQKNGGVLIGGTTGSGKTTTLKLLLQHFSQKQEYKNQIHTIENPIEYLLHNVHQHEVSQDSYNDILQNILSTKSKLLMMSEIRDKMIFKYFNEVIDKNLVLGTFFAQSIEQAPKRFNDFTENGSYINKNIQGIIVQKLLPIVCPHCSISIKDIEENNTNKNMYETYKRLHKSYSHLDLCNVKFRGNGCHHCGNLGLTKRTVCAEVITLDDKANHFINIQDNDGFKKYWHSLSDNNPLSDNMRGKNCMQHAIYKMLHGLICPTAVEFAFMEL